MWVVHTHKDFICPKEAKDYTIITENELKNEYKIPVIKIDGSKWKQSYGEIKGYDVLMESEDDIVGLCQYRRYFTIDEKQIQHIVTNNDTIIVKQTMVSNNVLEHYKNCHNINDLNLIIEIIKQKYPQYIQTIEHSIKSGGSLFIGNMFIMNKEAFDKYYFFLMDVLDAFNEIRGFNNSDDVYKYVHDNYKNYKNASNNNIFYQTRLKGFLAERIFTIYVMHNFSNIIKA